jgi:hypothetical protein
MASKEEKEAKRQRRRETARLHQQQTEGKSKNPKSGLDHGRRRNKDALGSRIARKGKAPKVKSNRHMYP